MDDEKKQPLLDREKEQSAVEDLIQRRIAQMEGSLQQRIKHVAITCVIATAGFLACSISMFIFQARMTKVMESFQDVNAVIAENIDIVTDNIDVVTDSIDVMSKIVSKIADFFINVEERPQLSGE